MLTDSELVNQFNRDAYDFYSTSNMQRLEIYKSFRYMDGKQATEIDPRLVANRKDKSIYSVNIAAPLVYAIAGSEVMAPEQLDFISTDEEFDSEVDIIGDAVDWCQHSSGYFDQSALARQDSAACGLGATVSYLDMTQKRFIAGKPMVERIAPLFCGWDRSVRGTMLNDKARFVFYADPMSKHIVEDYKERTRGGKEPLATGAEDFKNYILNFSSLENYDDIAFAYHYFWWEYTDIYDVANPYRDDNFFWSEQAMQDPDILNIIGKAVEDLQLDDQAAYWTVDEEGFKELTRTFELVGLMLQDDNFSKLNHSKRYGKCYYRAQFCDGELLKRSRSFTQTGFPLNFIVGRYEESTGDYFGFMRPLSEVQDYFNVAMTDMIRYATQVTTGGAAWVTGAGPGLEKFIKEKVAQEDTSALPEGTTVTPKAQPGSSQILMEFLRFLQDLLPRTIGLGPEFFGVITSGDMTDSLFGKVMKQSYAVLESWKNNSTNYDINQGEIFVDMVDLMADANDGMVLELFNDTGDKSATVRLQKQNLARNYAVRTIERPLTDDEKQENVRILSQLAPQAQQFGINLFPELVGNMRLEPKLKNGILEKMQPAPPPEPNPLDIATMEANIKYTNAAADKSLADIERDKIKVDTEAKEVAARIEIDRKEAEAKVRKEMAQAQKLRMESAEILAGVEREDIKAINEQYNQRLDSVSATIQTMAQAMQEQANIAMNKKGPARIEVKRDGEGEIIDMVPVYEE